MATTELRFNPIALTLAREAREMTQAELSEASSITQGTLSKIENGQIDPSAECIVRLATALRYTEKFFVRHIEYRNLPITFYRKRARVKSRTVRAVRARTQIVREQLRILLRSADIPELRIPMIDSREHRSDIESIAQEVRTHLHLPPGPIDNLTATLENAGVLVSRCDFGTTQIDALSVYEPGDLPPVLFVNPEAPGDRLRFSLAHELGHLVLHHHLAAPPEHVHTEDEADRFAGEFLMPRRDIRSHFAGRIDLAMLARLKKHWRVSIQALIIRARTIGRIGERYQRMLFAQLSSQGMRKQEPVVIPREEPSLMAELVDFYVDNLGYSFPELADALCIEVQELREMFCPERKILTLVAPPGRSRRSLGIQ